MLSSEILLCSMTSGNPGPEWREVWSAVRGPTATAIMNLAERELGINNPIKYLPRLPDDRKDPQPLQSRSASRSLV